MRAKLDPTKIEPMVMTVIKPQPVVHSDSTRLQIRLPYGKTVKCTLKSSKTLSNLYDILLSHIASATDHTLLVPFPHKEMTFPEDGKKTLEELGLCPSATLILQ